MKVAITASPAAPESAPFLLRGDLAEAFALSHGLGYDGVEVHVLHPRDIDGLSLARIASDYRMDIPTLGTGMAAGMEGLTFSDPDPGVRQAAEDRIMEHIDLAAQIKSAVTIGLIRGRIGGEEPLRTERWEALLDCLLRVCERAKECGVAILLEPLNRYECDNILTVEDGLQVIARLGMDNLKLLLDTFHMNIEEADVNKSILLAKGCIGHIHLADTNRWVVGCGHLDLGGVLRVLRETGYEGYLAYEVLSLPNARQAAEYGIHRIRTALLDQEHAVAAETLLRQARGSTA